MQGCQNRDPTRGIARVYDWRSLVRDDSMAVSESAGISESEEENRWNRWDRAILPSHAILWKRRDDGLGISWDEVFFFFLFNNLKRNRINWALKILTQCQKPPLFTLHSHLHGKWDPIAVRRRLQISLSLVVVVALLVGTGAMVIAVGDRSQDSSCYCWSCDRRLAEGEWRRSQNRVKDETEERDWVEDSVLTNKFSHRISHISWLDTYLS